MIGFFSQVYMGCWWLLHRLQKYFSRSTCEGQRTKWKSRIGYLAL